MRYIVEYRGQRHTFNTQTQLVAFLWGKQGSECRVFQEVSFEDLTDLLNQLRK